MREEKERASAAAAKNAVSEHGASGPPRGLTNLGNTCFLNSVVQNLARMRPLRQYFESPAPVNEGPMTKALRGVIRTMWNVSKSNKRSDSFSPAELLDEVGRVNPMFKGRQQHDSHEVLVLIIDTIYEEEIKRLKASSPVSSTSAASDKSLSDPEIENGTDSEKNEPLPKVITIIDQVFGGRYSQTMTCLECGYKSVTREDFNNMNLSLIPKLSPDPPTEEESSCSVTSGRKGKKKTHRKGANGKVTTAASSVELEENTNDAGASEETLPEETSTALIVVPQSPSPILRSAVPPPPPPPLPPPPPPPPISRIGPPVGPSIDPSPEPRTLVELLTIQQSKLTPVDKSQKQDVDSVNISSASNTVRNLSSNDLTVPANKSLNNSDFDEPQMVSDKIIIPLPPPPHPSGLEKFADISEDGSFDGFEFSLFSDDEDSKSADAEEKSTNTETDNKASVTSKKPTVGKVSQVGNAIMNFFGSKAPYGYKSIEGCLEDFIVIEKMEGSNSYACPSCTRKEQLRIAMGRAMKGNTVIKKRQKVPSADELDKVIEVGSPNSLQQCAQTEFGGNDVTGQTQPPLEEVKLPPSNKVSSVISSSSPVTTSASSLAGSDHVASDDDAGSEKQFDPNKSSFSFNRDMTKQDEDELIKQAGCDGIPMVYSSATRQQQVADLSDSLVIQMKRFEQIGFSGRPRKISGHVEFPLDLDLTPYRDYDGKPVTKSTYTLTGLSVHQGHLHGGHYVAYVRERTDSEHRGEWFFCSDTAIRKVSEKEVLKAEAYLLFYEKVSS